MQIHITQIEQLRYFAEQLEELRQAMAQQRVDCVARADEIKAKWDDSTYLNHRRYLDQMLEEVSGFELACDIHSDFLRRKYQAALDILRG